MDVLVITSATLRGEALRGLLAADAELNVALSSYEARRSGAARSLEYDVVVCDAADVARSAQSMIASLARDRPSRPIVAVTSTSDPQYCEYFTSGAVGVVRWDSSDEELHASIREVTSGNYYASRAVLRDLIGAARQLSPPNEDSLPYTDGLTAKERSVVELLLEGMTNQEIAKSLFLAEPTVKAHLGRVMSKWGVRDRLQVALKALKGSSHPRANQDKRS